MRTLESRVTALEHSVVRYGPLTAPGSGAVAAGRLLVGGGQAIQQIQKYTFQWAPGAVGASSVFVLTVTSIPGLMPNDWVYVVPPGTSNVPPCSAVVTGPGNLLVMFVNALTSAQTPATGTYTVMAIRV